MSTSLSIERRTIAALVVVVLASLLLTSTAFAAAALTSTAPGSITANGADVDYDVTLITDSSQSPVMVRVDFLIERSASAPSLQNEPINMTLEYESAPGSGIYLPLPLDESTPGTITGSFGPSTGFPVGPDYNSTTAMRVSIAPGTTPGPISTSMDANIVDAGGNVTGTLASFDQEVSILAPAPPVISSTLPATINVEETTAFDVTLTNPANGLNESNVRVDFTIDPPAGMTAADMEMRYESSPGSGTFLTLPMSDSGGQIVGQFGPSTGFPMPIGYNATTAMQLDIDDDIAGEATVTMQVVRVDGAGDVLAVLATNVSTYALGPTPTPTPTVAPTVTPTPTPAGSAAPTTSTAPTATPAAGGNSLPDTSVQQPADSGLPLLVALFGLLVLAGSVVVLRRR